MRVVVTIARRALVATFVAWVAVWAAFPIGGSWRVAAIDIGWSAVGFAAAIVCLAAATRPENRSMRWSFVMLAAGAASWSGGQTIWNYYELIADRPSPYPSLADAGYLASIPLLALSLVFWPYEGSRGTLGRVGEAMLAAGAAGIASFTFLVQPVLATESSGWGKVLDYAYPISEFGVTAIVTGAVLLGGWRERQRLVLMLCGFLAIALSDEIYDQIDYSTGGPLDIGWTVGLLCIGLVALPSRPTRRWSNARFPSWAWATLVVILLIAVGVEHAVQDAKQLAWADVAETGAIVALFLALVGRFFIVLRESERQTAAAAEAKDELALQQVRERMHRDRFLAEIVAAREDEARRVAGLLHDNAIQQLTAHMLRLELLERRAALPELGTLAAEAREVTRGLRRLMTELHPPMLESQGLAAAVEAVAEPLREQGIRVVIDPPEERPPAGLEQVAYRVVHEALVNVLKHAAATEVVVSIELTEAALHCEIRDDGRGFDASSVDSALSRGSLGLHLARERVELANGRLHIESAPGAGTSISFDLPLPEPSAPEPEGLLAAGVA